MKKSLRALAIGLYMAALVTVGLFIFQVAVKELVENRMVLSITNGALKVQDFVRYYLSGQIAGSPDAYHVYDTEVQNHYFRALVFNTIGVTTNEQLLTHYTPIVFPFCRALALLPISQAYIVFFIASALALASGLPLALNALAKRPWIFVVATLIATTCNSQAVIAIRMGQPSWLILALECFFYWSWIKQKNWVTGLSVALLFFKPHYALYFLTPIIVARRWPALTYCAAAVVILLSLGGLLIGFDNVINYPNIILKNDGEIVWHGIVSLRYIANIFYPNAAAVKISLIVWLVGLAVNLLLWSQEKKLHLDQTWLICCTVILCIFTSPHTYHYDLTMLGLLAVSLTATKPLYSKLARLSFANYRFLLIAYPGLSWLSLNLSRTEHGAYYDPLQSLLAIAMLAVLLVLAIICLFDRPKVEQSQST
ncbi:MAG: glycosyltransferase family 87 protein [Candidatus Obscuribacterales bacterium]|jgi:hypothetical protein